MELPKIPDSLYYSSHSINGIGIITKDVITKGTRISDYEGIVMTKPQFRLLYKNDIQYTYWNTQNFPSIKIIVAKNPKNYICYINESSAPNCILKKYGLYAINDIEPHTELTLRYAKVYPRNYTL